MARVRLFGPAGDAAGTTVVVVEGETVGEILAALRADYGAPLCEILDHSRVWLNEDEAHLTQCVGADDEVAVLPPVSGG